MGVEDYVRGARDRIERLDEGGCEAADRVTESYFAFILENLLTGEVYSFGSGGLCKGVGIFLGFSFGEGCDICGVY